MFRNYELIFIVQPDLAEEEIKELVTRFTELISQSGGEIEQQDSWGKRRLAYEIKDFREGYYFLVNFKGSAALARELDRVLKITTAILRFMLIRQKD